MNKKYRNINAEAINSWCKVGLIAQGSQQTPILVACGAICQVLDYSSVLNEFKLYSAKK